MSKKKKVIVKGGNKPERKKKTKTKTDKSATVSAFDELVLVEYLKSFNQVLAYTTVRKEQGMQEIKYSTARVNSTALFRRPECQQRLKELSENLVERKIIDLNQVIQQYADTAASNPAKLIKALENNGLDKISKIENLDDALQGFDVSIEQDESGKPLIKLNYRQSAVIQSRNSLTRILGGFKDNLNLTGKVSVVGQILDELDGDTSNFEPGE